MTNRQNNAQEKLLVAVLELVEPIRLAATDEDQFEVLFQNIGWDLDNVENFPLADLKLLVSDVQSLVDNIKALVADPPETLTDFAQALDVVAQVMSFVKSLDNFASTLTGLPIDFVAAFSSIGQDILEYLICRYLSARQPALYHSLSVLGIVDPFEINGYAAGAAPSGNELYWKRNPYLKSKLHLSRLGALLSDPKQYFVDTFYPPGGQIATESDANYFSDRFFPRVQMLMLALGFETAYGVDSSDAQYFPSGYYDLMRRSISAVYALNSNIDFGMSAVLAADLPGHYQTVIRFLAGLSASHRFGNWYLQLQSDGQIEVISIDGGGIHFPAGIPPLDFTVRAQLFRLFGEDETQAVGSTSGSRVLLKRIQFEAFLKRFNSQSQYGLGLYLEKFGFVIEGGDGDNFLNKIFPNGAKSEFDLTISWDNINGLHFNVSGGLEVFVPTHIAVGPLSLNGAKITAIVDNGAITLNAGASVSFSTGPLTASVENVGVRAILTFPGGDGNLGFANIGFEFKMPSGVGISVESSTVTGGGFLYFDESKSSYYGGLELKFSEISIRAIGVLTTKMPDGSKGYSLLIILTTEFTPVQLGFGFTLNGVGGLLGLNRTMNTDTLRSGLKDRTLDNILFPQDIVKNASSIISTISTAFPIKKDRFLIGPMAKIGWGTPTILTIDLGIIIELPSPVLLAILGVIKAILPDEKKPVVTLQINFLGVIDFDKKQLSFDATLYESKILTFGLFGDMALRLYWGDKPNFLMSVGGFHPKYTPPPMNLPQMQRLSIVLVDEDEVSVIVATYFAVTSNSVQFGARVDAKASAFGYNAIGALYFDILFKFSPFYFLAEMGAMFSVRKGDKELLTLYIDMSLEGPNPWRAQGQGKFKILGFNVEVSFDKTFGEQKTETVEAADVWPKLEEAIKHKDNWQVAGPDRSHQLVSFKEVALTSETILVDPFGSISFNQKVVPMNTLLGKFGTSAIKDFKKFTFTSVTATTNTTTPVATAQTREYFARAEYLYMSDDEKLSRDAFELFDSGMEIGPSSQIRSGYIVSREFEYENIVIDTRYRASLDPAALTTLEQQMHNNGNYIASSGLSTSGNTAPQGGPDRVAVLSSDEFYIVDRNTLQVAPASLNSFLNFSHAEAELNAMLLSQPSNAADYIIVNAYEL